MQSEFIVFLGIFFAVYVYALLKRHRSEKKYPPQGEFIVVEGLRLHYVRSGTGKPVVLLHGSDGFLQDFTETIFDQLTTEYEVIAFDRPGHGYSDTPRREPLTPQLQARLIHAALRRLGIETPLFVGHSWSGLLLLTYALQFPEAVAGLVLLAPWVYPPRSLPSPLLKIALLPGIGATLATVLLTPIKSRLIRYHLVQAFSPYPVPRNYSVLANALWQRYPHQIVAFAQENTNERAVMRELSPLYSQVTVPVTIITGNRDRSVNPSQHGFLLNQNLPDSSLVVLEGVGHALLTHAPEAILREIRDCWLRIPPQPSAISVCNPLPVRQDAKARALVFRYGWNSVAYQILNPEMEHWFAEENETEHETTSEAVIGFVRRNKVRIVAGAPICRESALAATAAQFEAEAHRQGERVCYFGATDRLRNALAPLPHHAAIIIGAQPVWQLANWGQVIKKNGSLRSQLNRARNKGVSVEEWSSDRAGSDLILQRCLEEWLATHPFPTLHFLTEPVTLDRLADRRVFVAEQSGVPVGFLIATPIPDRHGWLIEQIVRGKFAPNGTTELLVDGAMRRLAEEGYETVTLGLAPLSRRAGDSEVTRPHLFLRFVLKWVRAHGKRFYNFEGLDSFKAKFKPDCWEPMYALSEEPEFSLHTLYALAAAFSDGSPAGALLRALLFAFKQEIAWKSTKNARHQ